MHPYPTLKALAAELARIAELLNRPIDPAPAPPPADPAELRPVRWPGAGTFWLDVYQRRIVHELVEALLWRGDPDVPASVLLHAARAPGGKDLAEVFRGSAAWGTLVIPGRTPGTYRLAPLPTIPDARG